MSIHRKFAIGLGGAAAVLVVAGCTPAKPGTPIPSVVGMHADKAKKALQQQDAYIAETVNFHDVKPGETRTRAVLVDGHWVVCSQQPPAGSPSKTNMTVDLAVVKIGESCPGAVSSPSPAPARAPEQSPGTQAGTPAAVFSQPPTSVKQTTQAPVPLGTCKPHTVAYCGWDRGETPDQVGETATCKDGYVSFATTASGTCSGHGGVRVWFK